MTRRPRSALGLLAACVLSLNCGTTKKTSEATPAASGSGIKPAPSLEARRVALLTAEFRRDPTLVLDDDLTAQSGQRRLEAVRALARMNDERALLPLGKALGDEEPGVVSWAAFGLGALCEGHEPEVVGRLAVRAAALAVDSATAESEQARGNLALALGRCGNEEAERSLRAWLRGAPKLAESAALGLGRLARKRRRLDEATVAALLDAAAKETGHGSFFYPIESLPTLGQAARVRLLEVASSQLERESPARAFAARALAKAGPEAAVALGRLLQADGASDVERADAARALATLGAAGQAALASALAGRVKVATTTQGLLSTAHGVLLTLLEGLEPGQADQALLTELSRLPLEAQEPVPTRNRKLLLRCRAATLLAGKASESSALLACDPSPQGREGSLALLRVLGRASLAGARGKRFQELVKSPDHLVREAALELLMTHDELFNAPELLASALTASEVGVQATAAKVLARYPARASTPTERERESPPERQPRIAPADPRVVAALQGALAKAAAGHRVELTSWLMDAAAALELLGAKPVLERVCDSDNPTLRERAKRALVALGDRERRCSSGASKSAAAEPALPTAHDHELEFETDVGTLRLTLAGAESPFATERILELARAGFYDGLLVHRSVPGFLIQFGDPDADGFGGPDLPALRCQTGPDPFEAGSVGVALSGRDTGTSQLFITQRRAPHLDGDYSLVGRAGPGWERLSTGDRILKVRLLEGSQN